jgi:large subunit ribosomal protein L2
MKKYSPTSPSRRTLTTADYSSLTTDRPYKSLTKRLKSRGGRNSAGRITVRHQGGGVKKLYRVLDFKQARRNDPAKVLTVEYDPYRTAFIALVEHQSDKSKAYILAPHGLAVGKEVTVAPLAPFAVGNRMQLKNIPVGQQVYSVELQPGQGGILARSAGAYAEVLANADGWTDLKLGSGEVRRVNWEGYASIGQVSNPEHNLVVIGKAGRSRWLGIRPTVRGSVMNPVDHPYGGGEGRTQRGTRKPKTLWGKITGGHKTRRRKKQSNQFIVKRRNKK